MDLNKLGKIVITCREAIPIHFPGAAIDEYVVMPDHLHALIQLNDGCRGTVYRAPTEERFARPVPGSIPTIVRSFKSASTRQILILAGSSSPIWQRNYFEHVIRNENELGPIREYIAANPYNSAMNPEFYLL